MLAPWATSQGLQERDVSTEGVKGTGPHVATCPRAQAAWQGEIKAEEIKTSNPQPPKLNLPGLLQGPVCWGQRGGATGVPWELSFPYLNSSLHAVDLAPDQTPVMKQGPAGPPDSTYCPCLPLPPCLTRTTDRCGPRFYGSEKKSGTGGTYAM